MRAAAPLLTVMLSVAAGCGNASGHPADPSAPLPFAGIAYPSARDSALLHDAEEDEVAACMRNRGLSYQPVPFRPDGSADTNPYGLLVADKLTSDPYRILTASTAGQNGATANDILVASLPDQARQRWYAALGGTPEHRRTATMPDGGQLLFSTDGCVYLARQELYGSRWDSMSFLAQDLSNKVVARTDAAMRNSPALRTWARCMRHQHYSFTTLDDPRMALRKRAGSEVRAAGMTMARQDYRCERSAHLHETVWRLQQSAEHSVGAGHADDLRRFRALRRQVLLRANHIVRSWSE